MSELAKRIRRLCARYRDPAWRWKEFALAYDLADLMRDNESTILAALAAAEEVERLKPYYEALRNRHNGYSEEARKVMDTLREPASPEAALSELIDEAYEMGKGENEFLVEAIQQEVERLRVFCRSLKPGMFIEYDNSTPPQLWVFDGDRLDEGSEPICRVPPCRPQQPTRERASDDRPIAP